MTYTEFYNQYLNQRIDIDGIAGFQCVDIPKAYAKYVWGLDFHSTGYSGGAKDIIQPGAIWNDSDVTRTLNTPGGIPLQGAVIVFNGAINNPFGHTGVCISADINTITILEQNGGRASATGTGSDAIRSQTYNYTPNSSGIGECLGWITPKNNQLIGVQPVPTLAWVNSRGREEQDRFQYINQNNDLYCSWVASGKCDVEVANTLAERDNEIKNFKANSTL